MKNLFRFIKNNKVPVYCGTIIINTGQCILFEHMINLIRGKKVLNNFKFVFDTF